MYGSEIWGSEGCEVIEKLHLRSLKYILGVNKTTCNNMVYGELGVFPLGILARTRVVCFWGGLISSEKGKLSSLLYKLLHAMSELDIYHSPWLQYVKNILQETGFYGLLINQNIP